MAKAQPEKVAELEKILDSYSGDPRLLEIFLQRFGSDNPYEAASRAELKEVRFQTPEELQQRGEIVISESGHRLLHQVYIMQDRYSGELWKSGLQAIMKIMQAFGSAEQKDYYQRLGEKAERQQVKTIDDLVTSLEEVLLDPSRLKGVQSITERRAIFHILGINEELQKRLLLLEELRYGQSLPEEQGEFLHLVGGDAGGTFLGWFEREQNEKRLPDAIQEMYTALKTKSLLLDEKEYRQILSCLLVYAANHRYIQTEAAVGSYKQDFNYLLALPLDHQLFKKHGPLQNGPPQLREIDDLLSRPEITFLDAARIFELYPIDKVRREVNQSYAARFSELSPTLERLKPLFMKGGEWLEDSLGVSLPVSRLKKTIYFAALGRKDFLPVRDLLRVQTLAPGERMWKALSMAEFKRKVDGAVIAGRKVHYLDRLLVKDGAVIQDPEDAERLVEDWKPFGLRSVYDLVENFELEHGFSYDEFWRRAAVLRRRVHLPGKAPDVAKEEQRHQPAREFGLYNPKLFSPLLPLLEEAKQLTPYEQTKDLCATVQAVLNDRFVENPEVVSVPLETAEYLTPEEMKVLHTVAGIEKRLAEKREQESEELPALLTRRDGLRNRLFYRGYLELGRKEGGQQKQQEKRPEKPEERRELRRLAVERDKYHDDATCFEKIYLAHRSGEAVNLHLFQVTGLQQHLQQYQTYVPASELADFPQKIKFLTSQNAQPLLAKAGYTLPETLSWENAQDLKLQHYVHRDLQQAVEEMYADLEKAFSWEEQVVKEGKQEFAAAALYQLFTVRVLGTSPADARRFRYAFSEFKYEGKEHAWKSFRPRAKGSIGQLTEKVQGYNQQYQRQLNVNLVPEKPE